MLFVFDATLFKKVKSDHVVCVLSVCVSSSSKAVTMIKAALLALSVLMAVSSSFGKYIPKSGKRIPQSLSRGLWAPCAPVRLSKIKVTHVQIQQWSLMVCVCVCVCVCVSRLGWSADLGSDLRRGSLLGQVKVRKASVGRWRFGSDAVCGGCWLSCCVLQEQASDGHLSPGGLPTQPGWVHLLHALLMQRNSLCWINSQTRLSHLFAPVWRQLTSWTDSKTLAPVSSAALKKAVSEDNEIQKSLDEEFIVLNLVVSYTSFQFWRCSPSHSVFNHKTFLTLCSDWFIFLFITANVLWPALKIKFSNSECDSLI